MIITTTRSITSDKRPTWTSKSLLHITFEYRRTETRSECKVYARAKETCYRSNPSGKVPLGGHLDGHPLRRTFTVPASKGQENNRLED
jgi:hypothetical protein